MRFQSGKNEGKLGEVVLLKMPDLAQYMINENVNVRWSDEFRRLIVKFDQKPFTAQCSECKQPATRASAYQNTSSLMFWCDACNPYGSGARSGTLSEIRTFAQALHHATSTSTAPRTEKRKIILALAKAKGLPARVSEAAALEFFA